MENFKIDIKTGIEDELKETNKDLKTEVEARFRNQECERRKVLDEITTLEDEMKSMVWRQQCGECCCGCGSQAPSQDVPT